MCECSHEFRVVLSPLLFDSLCHDQCNLHLPHAHHMHTCRMQHVLCIHAMHTACMGHVLCSKSCCTRWASLHMLWRTCWPPPPPLRVPRHNVVHRDLKPDNILMSEASEDATVPLSLPPI